MRAHKGDGMRDKICVVSGAGYLVC
ncbi:hypothetical protein [Halioglobus sp. HI00S01]